jgi:hypothetical protein
VIRRAATASIDLHAQVKKAHSNVRGPNFIEIAGRRVPPISQRAPVILVRQIQRSGKRYQAQRAFRCVPLRVPLQFRCDSAGIRLPKLQTSIS